MEFRGRTANELVRIAAAGGGMKINGAGRTADELVRIAAAARGGGALVRFVSLAGFTTNELVRIAAAGKGVILLEE